MADVDRSPRVQVTVQRDLRRDLVLATAAHDLLLEALVALVDSIDIAAPSKLPGWTKGHVITHVINSGEGHALIFEEAAAGRIGVQYPHGLEGRAADIEAGAGRPAREQVDELRSSIARLEALWASSDWTGRGVLAHGAAVPITELPFLRVREVAIHHIDLDIGYAFDDLPAEYVRLELRRMEMMWAARQPMGMTPLPATALALAPPERLAWLMGRIEIEALGPAHVF